MPLLIALRMQVKMAEKTKGQSPTENKLNEEQRGALLTWIAADYSTSIIRKWFDEKAWPQISDAGISYYRTTYAPDIDRIRQERRDGALNEGLAIKAERVRRLCEHADELEAIKWEPDEKGRLWNEKAWRELLQQIADEMEPKKMEVTGKGGGALVVQLVEVESNISDG